MGPQDFPVEVCKGRVLTRKGLHVHFLHRHIWDTTVILEEFNPSHPQCPYCDMLVPWSALNRRRPNNNQCDKGEEWKRRRLAAEEMWASM